MGNTALEWLLLIGLVVAVGYIMYLEKQPKTDAERARRDAMADRMAESKRRQAEKMQRSRGIRLDD